MDKKPEDMAKISKYDQYDIDDLCTDWKSGWRKLAKLGYRQCPHELIHFGDKSQSPLEWVRLVVYEVFCSNLGLGKNLMVPKSIPAYDAALNLAASSNKKPYGPVTGMYSASRFGFGFSAGNFRLGTWAEDEKKWQKTLEKVLDALATSSTYREAFSKMATSKKNLERFIDFWSEQDVRWSKGEYFEYDIEPRLKEMMKWLRKGLRGKKACEEAWWNCLWLYMQPTVETMVEIKKKIRADTPLWEEETDVLQDYLRHGYLWIGWISDPDDEAKFKIQLILRPHPRQGLDSSFDVMSTVLLVPPAFDLAKSFQGAFHESRYLKQCRAPACEKWFYTGWKTATNCPGSNLGKKNKCSLEWNRYKRFLNKIGKNPKEDWKNDDLKEQFIDYDNNS